MLYVMLVLRAVIPLIYVLLIAGAMNLLSGKGLIRSMAPAFFAQIILILITAMAFGSINLGIYIGISCAVVIWTVCLIRHRSGTVKMAFGGYEDIIFAVIVYIVIWAMNFAKVYDFWDEYSHWGPFVKEMFRTDRLFCESPLQLVHKDYVPVPSLFETLWCRLMLGYTEPNCYRAIQMLQISMMLPACVIRNHSRYDRYVRLIALSAIPLLFTTEYYHTIVPDLLLGVLVFYCMWIVISDENGLYDILILAMSLTVMLLTKQTAIAFLPMIVIFCLVYRRMDLKKIAMYAAALTIPPIAVWKIFNSFSAGAVSLTGGARGDAQSYSTLSVSQLFRILLHMGHDPLQLEFDKVYFGALFTKPVMGPISFAFALFIVLALFIIWGIVKRSDPGISRGVFWISLWIILAAIAYVILMYYLYVATFGLDYAMNLSSFERYMASFLITAYSLVYSFIYAHSSGGRRVYVLSAVTAVVFVVSAFAVSTIDQVFPGNISLGSRIEKDEPRFEYDVWKLTETVIPEEAKVFILSRGRSADDSIIIAYLMDPMIITGGSFGPACEEDDDLSHDISADEFVKRMAEYDYIYIRYIDNAFMDKYSEAFRDPDIIEAYTVYRAEVADGYIQLSRQEEKDVATDQE